MDQQLDILQNQLALCQPPFCKQNTDGLDITEHILASKYGEGSLVVYKFLGIEIHFSDFKLKKDVLFPIAIAPDKFSLCFILIGEKILRLAHKEEDIICSGGQYYITTTNGMEGFARICSKKTYREIKIRLAPAFVHTMQLKSMLAENSLLNDQVMITIHQELLSVLMELHDSSQQGKQLKLNLISKVLQLLTLLNNSPQNNAFTAVSKTDSTNQIFYIKQLITSNLQYTYTTKTLAQKAGLNESTLRKEFKRIFGLSVGEFSRSQKIKHAKNLLRNTELSVYQIAEAIGYKNATHFTAAFKRLEGIAPLKFRNS